MKRIFVLIAAALAPALVTLSAGATVINASFTGLVQSQSASGFVPGSAISGSFSYDTTSSAFLSFGVGGQSIAPGYASSASLTPDLNTALYTAQVSPLTPGVTVNSTFSLDLEATSPWSAASAIGLLADTAQLASNLDLADSSFRYYTADADGSMVHSVVAQLTGVTVIGAVPEPSMFALLAFGLAPIFLRAAKRQR